MAYRMLELSILSAEDLKDVRHLARMQTRAVAWIDPNDKFTTQTDEVGGPNPVWNDKFILNVPEGHNSLTIEILSESLLGSRIVGTVMIPLESETGEKASPDQLKYLTCDVFQPNGQVHGKLYIAYRLREVTSGGHTLKQPHSDYSMQISPRSILKKPAATSFPSPPSPKKRVTFQDATSLPITADIQEADGSLMRDQEIDKGDRNLVLIDRGGGATSSLGEGRSLNSVSIPSGHVDELVMGPTVAHTDEMQASIADGSQHSLPHVASPTCLPLKDSTPRVRATSMCLQRNLTMGALHKSPTLATFHHAKQALDYSLQPLVYNSGSLFKGRLGSILLS
ncbi:hypothetical protein L7F22_047382 [Adiantum nelumboides]|nr:hypothetical protein [Adiantum nelumboides]